MKVEVKGREHEQNRVERRRGKEAKGQARSHDLTSRGGAQKLRVCTLFSRKKLTIFF